MRGRSFAAGAVAAAGLAASLAAAALASPAPRLPSAPGCPVFPRSNVWNKRVDSLPVATDSTEMIDAIGAGVGLHPDFGSFRGYGIPYNVVKGSQRTVRVHFHYASESDKGPYPIPAHPVIEAGSDHHLLIVNRGSCRLYELYDARHIAAGWTAGSGAIWDLRSNALRPRGWTSADAAGLPILPGLVRYSEVRRGAINHALRFTVPDTLRRLHLPGPARGRRGQLQRPATDGPAGALAKRLRHLPACAAGTPDRGRPQALRDDRGRQRLALVHHRRPQSALERRRSCTRST